jgi:hypothetical protein
MSYVRPSLAIAVSSSLLVLLAAACGGSGGSSITTDPAGDASADSASSDGAVSGQDGATSTSLTAALASHGFDVQNGRFSFLDMSMCCATSCDGNNPASPYAGFYVPPAKGQSASNPGSQPDGMSASWRLRADEAVLYVGPTPPTAKYFGFTPYLFDRDNGKGGREQVFASLEETLNNLVIGTEAPAGTPPFARTTAVIVAGDASTVAAAKAALAESGLVGSAVNVLTLDASKVHFGIDQSADTMNVLFRMAVVSDASAKADFIKNPGGAVYRLTPKAMAASSALPTPPARTKGTDMGELALSAAADKLAAAIQAAYPGYVVDELPVDDGTADPDKCIMQGGGCFGDNRDALYPGGKAVQMFANDNEFYVVFGADHVVSGKATYASASVYALQHLVGVAAVTSDTYAGSAATYLPGDADAAKLYAWKVARSCTGDAHCLEIQKGACPTGMDNGALGNITFRIYMEPSTKTAPQATTVLRDRILRFRKP